ncbi:hypothetical protein GMRT_10011 [Giardia muris]|uniref:Uncharacterized protein n=1 Tax=Giardia muris TaxID=5742 RepID=A0A4Z1SQU9_GIAMU|nr:hypothetical protein GMRT_10011 [Giardia muris]|eukprot:TNJ28070.1 hypothetical protein GMRT_10011 [Giardia muris]
MEQIVRAVPSVGNWIRLAEERLQVGDTEGASSTFEEALKEYNNSELLWIRYASLMPSPLDTLILERACRTIPLSISLQQNLLDRFFGTDRLEDATTHLKTWVNTVLALGRPIDVQKLLQYYIGKCTDPLHLTYILSELLRMDLHIELVERLYGLFPMIAERVDRTYYTSFCFQCFTSYTQEPEDVLTERGWIAARGLYHALLGLPSLESLILDASNDIKSIYNQLFLYREILMKETISDATAAIRRYLSLAVFSSLTTGIIDDSITASVPGLSIFSILSSPSVILSAPLTAQVIHVLKVSRIYHNLESYALQVLQLWRSELQTCTEAELLLLLSELFLCLKEDGASNLSNGIRHIVVEFLKMRSCFPFHRFLLQLHTEIEDISSLSHLNSKHSLTPDPTHMIEQCHNSDNSSNEELIARSLLCYAQYGKVWLRGVTGHTYMRFAELLCSDTACPSFRTCLHFAMKVPVMTSIHLELKLLNDGITSSSLGVLVLCARLMLEGELTDIHSLVADYTERLINMRKTLLESPEEPGRFLYLKGASLIVSVAQLASRLGIATTLFYTSDTINIEGMDYNTYRFEE